MTKEYKTITEISGPLIFVEKTEPVGYMELVEIRTGGDLKRGQVLDSSDDIVVIQIFEGTGGLSKDSAVSFTGDVIKMPLSPAIVGRVLSGSGKPRDGGPEIVPDVLRDIAGAAINPASREKPRAFIQTGISTIDGTNTLVRGQKLPIFSGAGLPHNDLALQIARQAKALGEAESFAVIFCAMGITQFPILTMPGDDITHPIPDLSGYITEGQILISRELHRKGIYPPVDIRPSLSRLMNSGIGKGHTREDHRAVSDQLYAYYAEGNDLRGLAAIVGKEALSERDKLVLEFADKFEKRFVNQGRDEDRSIFDTLQIGWDLLADLPEAMLTRVDDKYIKQYHPKYASTAKK